MLPSAITRLASLAALFACLAIPALRADEKPAKLNLFNGKDLTGWKIYLDKKDQDKDPAKFFTAEKDGVLKINGKVLGMIFTDKPFTNYTLSFDWLYPEGSTPESNSGALIHLQPPFNKIFPPSLEPQGRYKDHGKIFPMAGVKAENNKFDQEALDKALKPLGQWNSTEITCKADGSVSVKVNGTPVSSCTSKLKEGPVGFQSEGHEIHLKNIHLKPLD
ncbi:MAG: DUF1080 domain-containing protein [Planctomycetota bacterium]|jgi:hypothetical protein|nr:MAG: DUF1080 domain-containing protein [Planctomycetota bacterium]